MRKTREEKAITLIALIITIVVLLILSVVAINSVTGDGIIQHAVNAKGDYEQAQVEEESVLSYYEDYLVTEGKAGTWKKEENYIINSDEVKIPIGAKVNYDCYTGVDSTKLKYVSKGNNTGILEDQSFEIKNNSMEWYVLGEEHGKIMLISSSGVVPTDLTKYTLTGRAGYINGPEELNRISSTYGHGTGAETARSLSAEDINELAGVTEEIKKTIRLYGSKYEYQYNGSEVKFSKNGGDLTPTGRTEMVFIDEVINSNSTKSKIINDNSYYYSLDQYIKDTNILNLILNKKGEEDGEFIWLATQAKYIFENGEVWYCMCTLDGRNSSKTARMFSTTPLYRPLEDNTDYIISVVTKVRPVVILEKDIVLTESNGEYNITK